MGRPDRAAKSAGDAESIVGVLRRVFEISPPPNAADEGLRDRKKRMLRQKISDTATMMFLERGFDAVRVGEIADACDVSEKTVFNYFPTKESLVFDREEDDARQIADVLRNRRDVPVVDAVVDLLESDLQWFDDVRLAGEDGAPQLSAVCQFAAMVEHTPALQAAMNTMTERLTQAAAAALAERAGIDPDEPEAQLAASIILGLWRVQFQSMVRHAEGAANLDDVKAAVIADVRRAASVANGGLSSFNAVLSSSSAKDQLREAALAADHARRQMMAAVKQARVAWRQVVAEIQAHHAHDEHHHRHQSRQELRAAQNELRAEIRQFQNELRARQEALRREQELTRRDRRGQ